MAPRCETFRTEIPCQADPINPFSRQSKTYPDHHSCTPERLQTPDNRVRATASLVPRDSSCTSCAALAPCSDAAKSERFQSCASAAPSRSSIVATRSPSTALLGSAMKSSCTDFQMKSAKGGCATAQPASPVRYAKNMRPSWFWSLDV